MQPCDTNPSSTSQTAIPSNIPSDKDSVDSSKPYGPLTQSEAERLQLEANEDTTRSEDLRQFLQEMRDKIKEEQKQLQQQLQNAQAAGPGPQAASNPPPVSHPAFASRSAIPGEMTAIDPHLQQPQQHITAKLQPAQTTVQDVCDGQDAAPDGGWSWIVMFSSFCCLILVDGISLSYGLLMNPYCGYTDLVWYTNASSTTSRERAIIPPSGSCVPISELGEFMGTQSRMLLHLPGALLLGCYLFLGPLVSALTNQFDVRPVTMTGAVLLTIALTASAFINRLEIFTLVYGVLGGIGLSLIYLPAIATVGQWFQRRRPLAVGLALCGSGIGCLLGAQGVPRLIQWVTWRGALLIMAAASAQSLVLIAMFRSLEVHQRICQVQRVKKARNEAARRKAAMRRLEIERRLAEIRYRKRLAEGHKPGAEVPALYQGLWTMNDSKHARAHPKRYTHGVLDTYGMLQGTGNRVRIGAIVTRGGQPITLAAPVLHNRGDTGRAMPLRKLSSYRGTIMQRIIEEKHRQRTTSVGSLDGMVITRDNKLIAGPAVSDRPLLSMKTIARLSETIANKYEAKLQQVSNADGTAGSRIAFSRSLRENLPHIVQEYIQSQIFNIQQQQTNPGALPTAAPMSLDTPDALATDVSHPVRLPEAITVSSTPIAAPATVEPHALVGSTHIAAQHTARQAPVSNSRSETTSLRPHVSDTSLDSTHRVTGVQNTAILDASATTSIADAADLLLDNEIRAEIHTRLKRELSRPQYKKDLFYTGSVRQLNSTNTRGPTTVTKHLSFLGPNAVHSPNTSFKFTGMRTSVLGLSQVQQIDIRESQVAAPTGMTFVPPAPCPIVSHQSSAGFPSSLGQTPPGAEAGDNAQDDPEAPAPPSTELTTCSHNASTDRGSYEQEDVPDAEDPDAMDDYDGQLDLDVDEDDEDDDAMIEGDSDGSTQESTIAAAAASSPHCCALQRARLQSFCSPSTGYFMPLCSFMRELLSPGILTSWTFVLMLLSATVTMLGFSIPFIMLPDLLAELNMNLSDAGFALSAIGVSNTIGRLIAAMYIEKDWSTAYRWTDCLWLNNGSLLVSGLMVALMPFARVHYAGFIFICLVFGFCSAIFVSMKSILVVELLGLDRLTNAFGYMLLLQGVAAAAGLIVTGYMYDNEIPATPLPGMLVSPDKAPVHRAASVGFYFAGICLACGCVFGLPLRWLSRLEMESEASRGKPSAHNYSLNDYNVDQCSGDVPFVSDSFAFSLDRQQSTMPVDQGFLPPVHVIDSGPGILAVSTSSGVPCARDVGTPCVLATVNENVTLGLNAAELVLPPGGQPACLDDRPVLVIPASGVPVVPSAPANITAPMKISDVMGVPEDTGLEPVVEEEEEEEEYDDDEEPEPEPTKESQPLADDSTEPTAPESKRFEVVPVPDPVTSCSSNEPATCKRKKRRKPARASLEASAEPSQVVATGDESPSNVTAELPPS